MKYYVWGIVDPYGDGVCITAMVSHKNPYAQPYLSIKDWKMLLKEFPPNRQGIHATLNYARRVLARYHRIYETVSR